MAQWVEMLTTKPNDLIPIPLAQREYGKMYMNYFSHSNKLVNLQRLEVIEEFDLLSTTQGDERKKSTRNGHSGERILMKWKMEWDWREEWALRKDIEGKAGWNLQGRVRKLARALKADAGCMGSAQCKLLQLFFASLSCIIWCYPPLQTGKLIFWS